MTQAELRQRRKEAGLCIDCGRPAREHRTTCKKCAERKSREWERRYEKRLAETGEERKHVGRPEIYEYLVWRNNRMLKKGTAQEVGKYLGITGKMVCNYAATGMRRRTGLVEPVVIERRRLDD